MTLFQRDMRHVAKALLEANEKGEEEDNDHIALFHHLEEWHAGLRLESWHDKSPWMLVATRDMAPSYIFRGSGQRSHGPLGYMSFTAIFTSIFLRIFQFAMWKYVESPGGPRCCTKDVLDLC